MPNVTDLIVSSKICTQNLLMGDKVKLIDAKMKVQPGNWDKRYDLFWGQAGRAAEQALPSEMAEEIRAFAGKETYHALCLRNFPLSFTRLESTPTTNTQYPVKGDQIAETLLMGIAWMLGGEPYIDPNEKVPLFMQQIVPMVAKQAEQSSWGYQYPLGLFTHGVHERQAPDIVLSLCMRGNTQALTYTLPVDDLIMNLPPWMISEMLKPQFMMHSGPSAYIKAARIKPLLELGIQGEFLLNYNANPGRVTGIHSTADEVLSYLQNWLKANPCIGHIVLAPGDLIIYKNRRILMGRSAFDTNDAFSQRRWLMRMYIHMRTRAE